MIKKAWRKLNRLFAAPILCYFILLILSFCFLMASFRYTGKSEMSTFFGNLGYGLLGSTFVALLIDFSTSLRRIDEDKLQYLRITKDLRLSISLLIRFRFKYDKLGKPSCKDLVYQEWFSEVSNLRGKHNGQEYPVYEIFQEYCKPLLEHAKKLKEKTNDLADNLYLNYRFDDIQVYFILIDMLIKSLEMLLENSNPGSGYVGVIGQCLCIMFPEAKNVFKRKWMSKKMLDKMHYLYLANKYPDIIN